MTIGRGTAGGIVLAGGRSSRFGSDKLQAPLEGRRLLDLAVDAVLRAAGEVVVVVAPGAATPEIPPGVRVVRDREAHGGPLVGVLAGLEALDAVGVIVVGGDMPGLVPSVLTLLVDALDRAPASVLDDGAGGRPLPMAVRRTTAMTAARSLLAADERRLRALVTTLGAHAIPAEEWRALDPAGSTLLDVDRPEDLEGR